MRVSIRFQILLLVGSALLLSLGAYLALATRLLAEDKLAYIYDLESSLTATVSEQVEASLRGLADKLAYFASEATHGDGAVAAASLLGSDPDILAVEIWRPGPRGFERAVARVDRDRLASTPFTERDLAEARRTTPVPFEAVAAEGLVLQNASVPPDLAMLSLAAPAPEGNVVVALVRPDRLLRIFARSPAYRAYLVDGMGRILVHPDPSRVVSRASPADEPIVAQATRGPLARAVREVDSPAGPVVAAFARARTGRLAVVTEVPREEALQGARQLARRSLLFGLGILCLAVLGSVFFARRLTAPLRSLEEATRAVAAGDFAVSVPVASRNEIGRLADAFRRMASELSIRETSLAEAHAQLAQSEKLAVLGEISAAVVHEVRNPVTGILGYAQLGLEQQTIEGAREHLRLVEQSSWRASEILNALLQFARYERAAFERLDPNQLVADSLRLLRHQLQLKKIRVETSGPPHLPAIHGSANHLQQVLVNLVMNAAQAMDGAETRTLTVATSVEGDFVLVSVRDTGSGMSPEVREKLFTPFFTTKPRGQGTGLGLSVSQRIVRRHRGDIRVESVPGRGSTFQVRIPIARGDPPDPEVTPAPHF